MVSPATGSASAASVNVTLQMNGYATAQFTTFSGTEAALKANAVTDSSQLETLGKIQDLTFQNRVGTGDSFISIEDGAGNTLEFTGFVVGPGLQMNATSINPMQFVTGEGTMLENLKLSIYKPYYSGDSRENTRDVYVSVGDKTKTTNLADRIKVLTEEIIKKWRDQWAKSDTPSKYSQVTGENRDRINQSGPLEKFYELLENSKPYLDYEWMQKIIDSKGFNRQINNHIIDILRTPADGFSAVLNQLMRDFKLMWVPDPKGGVGYLDKIDKVVAEDGNSEFMLLNTAAIDQKATPSASLFPVKQVVMKGLSNLIYYTETLDDSNRVGQSEDLVLAAYPEGDDIEDGDVFEIQAPFFLQRAIAFFGNNKPSRAAKEDFRTFKTTLSSLQKIKINFHEKVVEEAAREYCRAVYRDSVLKASTLGLSVPLDVTLTPGRRYLIQNDKGDTLFTGFLDRVSHTVSRNQGSGVARSDLSFSHVAYPGFTVPE